MANEVHVFDAMDLQNIADAIREISGFSGGLKPASWRDTFLDAFKPFTWTVYQLDNVYTYSQSTTSVSNQSIYFPSSTSTTKYIYSSCTFNSSTGKYILSGRKSITSYSNLRNYYSSYPYICSSANSSSTSVTEVYKISSVTSQSGNYVYIKGTKYTVKSAVTGQVKGDKIGEVKSDSMTTYPTDGTAEYSYGDTTYGTYWFVRDNIEPKMVNLIAFHIAPNSSIGFAGEPHVVEEGMTWSEYVSAKNRSWTINSYGITDNMGSWIREDYDSSLHVYGDDEIIEDHEYYFVSSCCFVAGTQVLTSLSGETKNIEEIRAGDEVVSYDIDTGENYMVTVQRLVLNKQSINMAKVTCANGTILEMTDYHPLLCEDGFHSITMSKYPKLVIGDKVKTIDGWSEVTNIEQYTLSEPITTYTLAVRDIGENPDNDEADNFYANGICAHNAGCPVMI